MQILSSKPKIFNTTNKIDHSKPEGSMFSKSRLIVVVNYMAKKQLQMESEPCLALRGLFVCMIVVSATYFV